MGVYIFNSMVDSYEGNLWHLDQVGVGTSVQTVVLSPPNRR